MLPVPVLVLLMKLPVDFWVDCFAPRSVRGFFAALCMGTGLAAPVIRVGLGAAFDS